MSAKLLYTLSDDNQNLRKQIGCMNGFLQFFDRGRTIHRRLPPGEGSDQQRDGNAAGKRSKEKHRNFAKDVQMNTVEPSRVSISSSTGSTTMSSSEYDSTIKTDRSPFYETTFSETNSWDSKLNQSHFSPYRSNSSPIVTPKRQPMTNQIDSPRFLHPSKLDSPRPTSLNESFRSISSNQSAPVTPHRKKDASRMSYDGTETRDKFVTSLKFGDLPRLSLDSRQRTINKSVSGTRKDLHLTDQIEEPGSYRPPANIVVKLMGLDNLPDYTPTHKNQIELDRFDSLSRSSRTIDESPLIRALDSPRNNSEARTPRLRKEPAARKSQDGNPDCGRTATKCSEVQPKSPNQSLTLYGEIERKLADLDFKKSGKDLRALKQILEAIHREKTMNDVKKENHSSHCLDDMSTNSNSRQTKSPQKGQTPQKREVSKHPQDIKTRSTKSAKPVGDSAKGGASNKHNLSLLRFNQQRCDQPAANALDSVDEKATKTDCSRESTSQTQSITSRDLSRRTPRPIRTSKATEHVTKGTFTSSVRISGSTKMYRRKCESESQSHDPVATLTTRTKQHNQQQTVGPRPQNQQLQCKSSILQNSNVGFSDLTPDIPCLSHQRNSRFLLIDNGSFCQADSKSPERIKGDQSFAELPIDMKEQPSPVSVLDAKFYGDESPSPVKKKLTTFTAYDDSTSTTTENELKDIDITDSPYSIRLGFSCDSDHQRQEKFTQSGHAPRKLSSNQGGNATSSITPQMDIKLEMEYVREILLASGFLDDLNFIEVNHSLYHWKGTLNPNLFFVLEQTRGNRLLSHDDTRSKTMKRPYDKHRRLVFDVVNEILIDKLPFIGMGHQLQLLLNRLSRFRNGQQLLREILKEVDGLQANNFRQSVDDEETFLTSIIERDLIHRSANWTDSNSEISGLVLDIERLIFKDLISELVYEEAPHFQAQT